MAKVFLTGATGFVGQAVARALCQRGDRVRALVRPGSQSRLEALLEPTVREAIELVPGDVTDAGSVREALRGCSEAYHVAGRYSLWNPDREAIYRINVEGTRNVLEASRQEGVERIVVTGTAGTLRAPAPGRQVDESSESRLEELRGHYKRSKWLAEREARRQAGEGLHVVIVKPTVPVGPGDVRPTPSGRMILDFLLGRVPAYTATGLNLVAIEDCARAHLLAAERGERGAAYLIGGENLSLLEVYTMLGELTGGPVPRFRVPCWSLVPFALAGDWFGRFSGRTPRVPWEALEMAQKKMVFDISRARRELGFRSTEIRPALARASLWFIEQGYVARAAPQVVDRLRQVALSACPVSDAQV